MLVLLNCKKGDNFLLLLVRFSPFPEPDTPENCDLGYGTHFLLAAATQEVKTVKGQWLTSPVKTTLANPTSKVLYQLIRGKQEATLSSE